MLQTYPKHFFSVKDTGIGIPPDQLSIIFEPFKQVLHKEKNTFGGTGLGLSITRRLTELLGGKISVESEIDKGSVFNVSLFDIEIRQSREKLVELNATKDKFFSIIAHDLKNPFNSLLGFSDLLVNNALRYTPEKVQEIALTMNKTSKHTYTLLENLLEWARLKTSGSQPNLEKVKLSELLYEVKLLNDQLAKSKT